MRLRRHELMNIDKTLNRIAKGLLITAVAGTILAMVIILCTAGCSSPNAATTTGNALIAVKASADAVMSAWGSYVAAAHPGTNAEQKALGLWRSYKSAELSALYEDEAWLQIASTNTATTNAPPDLLTAQQAEQEALDNLIQFVASFGVTNFTLSTTPTVTTTSTP